jgi:hypothetical protein
MPVIIALSDLESKVGAQKIAQYFDDNLDADLTSVEEVAAIDVVLDEAEGEYFAEMLKGFKSKLQLIDLANADPVLKGHIAWIGVELASERRTEFTDAEGKGAHWIQYTRAIDHFQKVARNKKRSGGEETAGKGANVGGVIQPKPPASEPDAFIFASSKGAPRGHGGF